MKGIFSLLISVLVSQTFGQSIYSFQGLGELQHQGMPNNFAMGEVGIGTPTPWHVNTINPANLVYNQFSSFQVGLEVDRRTYTSDEGSLGDDVNGGLRFIAYAFPIKPGIWSSSFGILPYSSVNYNAFTEGTVEGTDGEVEEIVDDRGEGGLTSLYWSNGIALNKNFYIGIRSNFTFGAIEREKKIIIAGDDIIPSNTTFTDTESYSDINFQFGLAYNKAIGDDKFFRAGLIYTPKSALNGTAELNLSRLSLTDDEIEVLPIDEIDLNTKFPEGYGFGVSYHKSNFLTIGIDFETQKWSQVTSTRGVYDDFYKVAVGLEWIPDYDNISSYFKRTKYMLGASFQNLPYVVSGESLTDFGINFGTSLPVSGSSSMDLAFKFGRLGSTNNGLIRETYFKFVLGATINDRWFIKRRYD